MTSSSVGVLNEGPLHASLKEWYRRPGDHVEQPLEGFVIDLVREDILVEIQTGGFSAMRKKFDHLLDRHPIRLVHPIASEKWVVKVDSQGENVSRRKSPKRGVAADVCSELVSFPSLLSHPNFTLEVVMVHVDEVRSEDAKEGLASRRLGHRRAPARRCRRARRAPRTSRPDRAPPRRTPRSVHHRRSCTGVRPSSTNGPGSCVLPEDRWCRRHRRSRPRRISLPNTEVTR